MIKKLFLLSCLFISLLLYSEDIPRLVFIETMTLPKIQERTEGLISHLANEGYINGDTVEIEIYNSEQNRERARSLLRTALQKGKPTLVLTAATIASQEVHDLLKGTDIPQVFYSVTDPVKAGLINEMNVATGEKITGLVHVLPDEKITDIAIKVLSSGLDKKPFNIGFFYSSYPSSLSDYLNIKNIENVKENLNIIPLFIEQLDMTDGLQEMLDSTKKVLKGNRDKYDFIWFSRGPLGISKAFVDGFFQFVKTPVIMASDMYTVKKGALLTVMSSPAKDGYDVGEIVIDILKGTSIEDIPVIRSKHFQIGINLATAKKMGIVVPFDILDLARNNLVY